MTTRRELTFQACDALAAQGIKPAMSAVRKWTYENGSGKRGSDTDVQGDIHAWYDSLLKLKRDAVAVPGLPDHVASKAVDFWLAAQDAAFDQLNAEREAVAQQREDVAQQLTAKDQEMTQMRDAITALRHELDLAGETLRARDDTIKRLQETATQLQAVSAAKDERIEGVSAELSRKAADHAAALVELDGLRRHSLVQIDNARGEARHWKAEHDRVDAEHKSQIERYRQRAAHFETEAAALRGRLEAVDAELGRRIAAETAHLASLAAASGPATRPVRVRPGLAKNARAGAHKARVR